jgi:hypothetical protein
MDHPSAVYALPRFLIGVCTPEKYRRWLSRKARAHVKRDRKRGNKQATIEAYKQAIHQAVERSGGLDHYTGRSLRWDCISQYSNTEAKEQGRSYKKDLGDLPTVDHVDDRLGPADFVICSWRVNDAKNDLSLTEFLDICQAVLTHHGKVSAKLAELKSASGQVEFPENWRELEDLELDEQAS